MMKKDISANLYQKYLILCSKILLSVLNNTSVTVLLPLEHTGFRTSPILKAFLLEFLALFNIVLYIVYFRAENHYKMLKLSRLGLEKSAWEQNFSWPWVCSYRTIGLPSFNDLSCKLAEIALFLYLI